ncbi:chloramphenicol-sensitive protein RarD [Nocardioides daedukensis]|uniref:Chloramphenicol-sensitive protein RarD n=1 Tax=Nocardioides daedukensis TaxID=634462 RepID=A0A7Y9S342_9ACTN|nr:EamA family transporter RarD [Nocardioides daedukensis]NYG58839.1 chloramphenicol-sensitive protein RarD [Nocardioides daedukensis]
MSRPPRSESQKGFILGVAAYGIWGAFPLYWPLLEPAGAVEILAHRVVWSMLTMAILIFVVGRTRQLRDIWHSPRTRRLLTLGSVVIAINWGTYIWGVNNGHVVEASLGYFINPLVTMLMGVLVFRERLRPMQWFAVSIATAAVIVLTLAYGRLPWVALILAFSFGTYGLAKKQANTGAVESLTWETIVLSPIALGYVIFLIATGNSEFGSNGAGHAAILMTAGLITAVPLICFGAAATRLPMVTLGLLQYLAPILQFALGVLLFHEDMPLGRWIGFGLVWIALVIFTVESVNHRRRQLRIAADASAI